MSDYESNYNNIRCPFCDAPLSQIGLSKNEIDIDCLDEDSSDFFPCQECDKFFKVTLEIFKTYDYIIETPTKKEVEEHGLLSNKDVNEFEDVLGQSFMWDDLFLDKS